MNTRKNKQMTGMVRILLILLTSWAWAQQGRQVLPKPRIIYVDSVASGGNDGSSWGNAFNYLQDALNLAQEGDEIRVAQGLYKPSQGELPLNSEGEARPWDRIDAFELISGAILRGGFAGSTETDPDEWGVEQYPTILSGDIDENDTLVRSAAELAADPSRDENSLNIFRADVCDANTVLDGFVITGCQETSCLIYGGSPTIKNCVFKHCLGDALFIDSVMETRISRRAEGSEGPDTQLGADPNRISPANVTVENCHFLENDGAGCRFSADSSVFLTRCVFSDNTRGGIQGGTHLVVRNTLFDKNGSSNYGGAIACSGSLEITDCDFVGNQGRRGGALWLLGGDATINRASFIGNTAELFGGAIRAERCDALSVCCSRFSGNSSRFGGAISIRALRNTHLTRCLFTGNYADDRGAVIDAIDYPRALHLSFCTFFANGAPKSGAINIYDASRGYGPDMDAAVVLTNCILWGNSHEISVYMNKTELVKASYCDIQGGWAGEGNFDADPLFVNAGYLDGDFHLMSQAGRWDAISETWMADDVTSPCIDAGDPNSPIGLEPFPNGGMVNSGVYGGTVEASKSYFGEPVCNTIMAGDVNGDCKVDSTDIEILLRHWH